MTAKTKDKESSKNMYMRIINKAAWLLEDGRVVKISDYMFYVMGRKNRHIVKVENGKLICTCPGYREKGICSHVVAVSTLLKMDKTSSFVDERINMRLKRELKNLHKIISSR